MKLPHVHLPLTARGFGVLRMAQWLMVVLILGSIAAAVWLWRDSGSLEAQAVRYEQAAARLQNTNQEFMQLARQEGFDLSETRNQALAQEVAFANTLMEKREFSWTRFLGDLEAAVQPKVSIASVKLDFKNSTITLNGAALNLKALTALVKSLEDHPAFQQVVLSRHQVRENAAKKGRPASTRRKPPSRFVEFILTVKYSPTLEGATQ